MKKRILFVIPTLSCGGAERALVALLNKFDYNKYDCDLMLFRRDDMYFKKNIPKNVNLLDNDEKTNVCFSHVKHLLKPSILIPYLYLVLIRIYTTTRFKLNKFLNSKKEFYDWDYIEKRLPFNKIKYDVAISFLEGNSNFYVATKVHADIKIGWIRSDYEAWGYNKEHDYSYFDKLDKIFTVSEKSTEKMRTLFPTIANKFEAMYNVLDYEEIDSLSQEKIDNKSFEETKEIKIVSIGNLRYVKGYDRSIEACNILKKKSYKFRWYIVGEGQERSKLEKLIDKYDLKNEFILCGLKRNPYPYLKNADIYVQASRHEGFSTSIREAKHFGKPIVIVDCPGMSEQIENKYNGFISYKDNEEFAKLIGELINDDTLRKDFSNRLIQQDSNDNNKELDKLYQVIK